MNATQAEPANHSNSTAFEELRWSVSSMDPPRTDSTGSINNSVFYKEFLAERQEILCHKWVESEKAGYDIGFERALLDWVLKYRSAWREKRHRS